MKEKFDLPEDMYFEKDGELVGIMNLEPDAKVLSFAREYDEKQAKKKSKHRRKSYLHIAAMIMVCFVTLSAITLETSDAFRVKILQVFSNKEDGSATLLSQDEDDLIGDLLVPYLYSGRVYFAGGRKDRVREGYVVFFTNRDGTSYF